MPNESQIRSIVQQELAKSNSKGQFGVNTMPKHTHNGVDSVSIFSPTITYTGFVPSTGDAFDPNYTIILPSGWSLEKVSTGIYNILHNLDTNLYTVTVCNASGEPLSFNEVIPIVIVAQNLFRVHWWDVNSLVFADANFYFQLVQPNNKRNALPTYTLNDPS